MRERESERKSKSLDTQGGSSGGRQAPLSSMRCCWPSPGGWEKQSFLGFGVLEVVCCCREHGWLGSGAAGDPVRVCGVERE